MKHWLMKSEPSAYSIDDLARDGSTNWNGIRNYQARNYMREMKVGDRVLFYASNANPPGAVGMWDNRRSQQWHNVSPDELPALGFDVLLDARYPPPPIANWFGAIVPAEWGWQLRYVLVRKR